jgi:hypothetical protein
MNTNTSVKPAQIEVVAECIPERIRRSDMLTHQAADPLAEAADRSLASQIRADLLAIAELFGDADTRSWRARALREQGEAERAEVEREDAAGKFWRASTELADLMLLLLRHCLQHRRVALSMYLSDALRDPLSELAEAIVRLEGRRV